MGSKGKNRKTRDAGINIVTQPRRPGADVKDVVPSKKKAVAMFFGLLIIVALVSAAMVPLPVAFASSGVRVAEDIWNSIPAKAPADVPLPQRSTILDRNGTPYATFYAENRIPYTSDQIPAVVKNAFVAIEDQRFYENKGFDLQATLRALASNASGKTVQGGSGITQQYVKNLIVFNAQTPEEADAATAQTLPRKIKELKSAVELEKVKTKDEILTGYLNTVYFGSQTYGIGAASQHYFGKTPTQLSVAEAATLAASVNNANIFNPVSNPTETQQRRDIVLTKMREQGYITPEQETQAKAEPLALNITYAENGCISSAYPFYCAWVRDILSSSPEFGSTQADRDRLLYRGGLVITTALDPKAMSAAQSAADAALEPAQNEAIGIAVVEPGTGFVPAIATNRKYGSGEGQTEMILPILPSYQQGSTFKPFTSIAALESGVSPDIRYFAPDAFAPENRNAPEGGFHNYNNGPGGDYDMAGALRHSINTWFVQLEDRIGVVPTAQVAQKLGITSLPLTGDGAITEKDASLTLGTFDTSPLQVANAYATIAAHGVHCNPIAITKVTMNGTDLSVPPADCQQVVRASSADTVAAQMATVIDSDDPGRTGQIASIGRPAAGKTGTADSFSAVWFAGFTPQYATAVWVGDPRGGFEHPLTNLRAFGSDYGIATGGAAPAMAWKIAMTGMLADKPVVPLGGAGGESYVGTPYIVPSVIGLSEDKAKAALIKAGFVPTVSPTPGPAIAGVAPGTVTGQDPTGDYTSSVSLKNTPVQIYLAP